MCLELSACFRRFHTQCSDSTSCKCHVCLRQSPSLRGLASYAVFHITNNLFEFTLSSETLYHHYVRAVKSEIVPAERLIPTTFPHLRCTFARSNEYLSVKRYHKACVDPYQFPWYTQTGEYCDSKKRLLPECVRTNMSGGVISAKNRYSHLQTVCSANLNTLVLLYAIKNILPCCFFLSTPCPDC